VTAMATSSRTERLLTRQLARKVTS
jgi:hypothetical protein